MFIFLVGDQISSELALLPTFPASFFSFSRRRTGYSGVATYCTASAAPIRAEEGLAGTFPSALAYDEGGAVGSLQGLDEEFTMEERRALDAEGRAVITEHQLMVCTSDS